MNMVQDPDQVQAIGLLSRQEGRTGFARGVLELRQAVNLLQHTSN